MMTCPNSILSSVKQRGRKVVDGNEVDGNEVDGRKDGNEVDERKVEMGGEGGDGRIDFSS